MIGGVLVPVSEADTSYPAQPDPSAIKVSIYMWYLVPTCLRPFNTDHSPDQVSSSRHVSQRRHFEFTKLLELGRSTFGVALYQNNTCLREVTSLRSRNLAFTIQMTHLMWDYAYFPYSAMLVSRNGRSLEWLVKLPLPRDVIVMLG